MNEKLQKIKESHQKLIPILKNIREEINKLKTTGKIDPKLQIIQNQLSEMERILITPTQPTQPIDPNEPVA